MAPDDDREPVLHPATAARARTQRSAPAGKPTRISSDRLFSGAPEIEIDHHGAVYRLKRTALGKLILTK